MSSRVYVMTHGRTVRDATLSAYRGRHRFTTGSLAVPRLPCLTVPLLCSGRRLQAERAHQVQRRGAQFQAVQRRPQVDDVALGGAAGVKAREGVGVQVDTQGAAAAVAAVDRAGAAALR